MNDMIIEGNHQREEEMILKLTLNFLKLISKFSHEYYPLIQEWKEFPSMEELKEKEKMEKYFKRIKITIPILIKQSLSKNQPQVYRVLMFTNNLIQSNDIYQSLIKLNLLVNNIITLIQIIGLKEEKDINLIMLNYLSVIIKNFKSAYNNTFAYLLEIIKDNLSYYNDLKHYFDYEQFFINEDKYLNEVIVPQIKEEINLINDKIGDKNFIEEFQLNSINFENDLDLLYLINVLYEIKDLIQYKNTYSEKEYEEYKIKKREKVLLEKKEKIELSIKNLNDKK
jgi:hypothetical protein